MPPHREAPAVGLEKSHLQEVGLAVVADPPRTLPPLRVAFCIDNMNIGGTEMNAVRTARLLREAGVELRVFSLVTEGPLLDRYAELGIPVHLLPIRRLYGRAALDAGRRLLAMLRLHSVEVVHAHDFYSNIFAAPWARMAGTAFIASRRWWEGPDRRAQRWANRASYALAHRVLANSESVADLLVRTERVRRSRVVVVPNFLDDEAFNPPPPGWRESFARKLGLSAGGLVVGVVASLSPIKDHATLLRAVAALAGRWPGLRVVLAGADGGSQPSLEGLAAELGIADRIRYAGLCPNHPSPHHLFDIAALTSVSEGLPNSVLEAMASARPVVATRVGAIPDAVVDGETGLLVPPQDPEAVAGALDALLRDPERRVRAGAAGRDRARAQYSSAAAIGRLCRLYRELARR